MDGMTKRIGGRPDANPAWFDSIRKGDTPLELQDAIPMWAIYVMMKKRDVTRVEIAEYLGLTKQRVQAMMLEGEKSHARLEEAITAITEDRHHKRIGHTTCQSTACGVYLDGEEPEDKTRTLLVGLEESGWTDWDG